HEHGQPIRDSPGRRVPSPADVQGLRLLSSTNERDARVQGCPSDKATIEHLNRKGPFYWCDGLLEEDLVLSCGSCNSSRGTKRLAEWFESPYCVDNGITASTVADAVQQYLHTPAALE